MRPSPLLKKKESLGLSKVLYLHTSNAANHNYQYFLLVRNDMQGEKKLGNSHVIYKAINDTVI